MSLIETKLDRKYRGMWSPQIGSGSGMSGVGSSSGPVKLYSALDPVEEKKKSSSLIYERRLLVEEMKSTLSPRVADQRVDVGVGALLKQRMDQLNGSRGSPLRNSYSPSPLADSSSESSNIYRPRICLRNSETPPSDSSPEDQERIPLPSKPTPVLSPKKKQTKTKTRKRSNTSYSSPKIEPVEEGSKSPRIKSPRKKKKKSPKESPSIERDRGTVIVDPTSTELHQAIYDFDLARVKKILKSPKGSHLINKSEKVNHYTPVALACEFNLPETKKLIVKLVKHGADLKCKTRTGCQTIHIAAGLSNTQVLKYLLDKGLRVNKRSKVLGATPIYYATAMSNIDNVKYLFKHGAKCNKKTKDGLFPLYVAAQNGNLELVKILVNNGADLNMYWKLPFFTPARIAKKMKHHDVFEFLKEQKALQKGVKN